MYTSASLYSNTDTNVLVIICQHNRVDGFIFKTMLIVVTTMLLRSHEAIMF